MSMIRKLAGILLALGYTSLVLAQLPQQNQGATLQQPLIPEPLVLNHRLNVTLDPFNEHIEVADFITIPETLRGQELIFHLNGSLEVTASSPRVEEVPSEALPLSTFINSTVAEAAATRRYRVSIPANGDAELFIGYQGQISNQAEQISPEYAQSFAATSGIISEQGVFLSAASRWVPTLDDELLSFELGVEFVDSASSWTAVSQGDLIITEQSDISTWRESQPMEEIYLIAADFTVYQDQADDIAVLAYLRTAEPNLATRYMDATVRYLKLYEPLLGDYPFNKFALVENFWETGYGMPSFTLLGPQVIRLPFILESSYPHEILHNWWGNGVYPDYDAGNWSEGLTAYLADHLFREMDGAGHDYRKQMLARYKNYVADGTDFPLSQFTSRNSAATQAVGYGKTLMLWHMLRLELGDELFIEGLRQFYAQYKFRRASYEDIERHFSALSGLDLSAFFQQWVQRTGAPALSVDVQEVNGNRARIMFAQTQFEDPYALRVPIALYYEGESEPQLYDISLSQKTEGFLADDYDRLQAVLVDPYFDVFRTLDREETPPSVGELFGASAVNFILPTGDREHWTRLAESFGNGLEYELFFADTLETIPADKPSWILGRDNPLAPIVVEAAAVYGVAETESGLQMAGSEIGFEDRTTLILGRHPDNPDMAIGWLHVDDMIAMPGTIEKLPHYGRYSYVSFTGDEPTIDIRGEWEAANSPLQWVKPNLEGSVAWDSLPIPPAIAELPPKYLPEQLARHSEALTSPEMEGRQLDTKGRDRAALYIADQFRNAGLETIDGTYIQRWTQVNAGLGKVELANVVGIIPGVNRDLSAAPVVIGAHYDHLGIDADSGEVFAGADDNASGVAVMIELATKLARAFTPQRPVIFVAFDGEEAGLLGSDYFVNNPPGAFEKEKLFAMINLDAVGRLEGRTLQVFGTESAYEWPFMAQGIGFTIGVPSAFPEETIASGDHVSFLNAGIPAIHVFSGIHLDYHSATDTADKLDLAGMSDVALWVEEATLFLGDRVDPLRVNLENAQQAIQVNTQTTEREASLGTVPDFAYSGDGIRISDVTPGGAAEQAGLQANDVLLSYDGNTIDSLQSYSNLIRGSAPGDMVTLEIQRNGQVLSVEVTLLAR